MLLTIDPLEYDVWTALPAYFLEQSPFYVKGVVTTPTAFIEVKGRGIVAEAEVLLVETVTRPDDPYWLIPADDSVSTYSLVDLLQLDFHHPLLRNDLFDSNDTYEVIRKKWSEGYRVPSTKWTRETYEAHLFLESQMAAAPSTTTCTLCHTDLQSQYGPLAHQLLEYHVTGSGRDGIWVCPTCHKAQHYKE